VLLLCTGINLNGNKALLSALMISLMLIVCSSSTIISQEDDKLSWAEEGKFIEYSINLETIQENENQGENMVYIANGDITYTVESAKENYADMSVEINLNWEDNKVPPNIGNLENLSNENWFYDQFSGNFLPKSYFENLKNEDTPKILENYYEGVKNVKVPYDNIKSFHINTYQEKTIYNPAETETNLYYGYNSGILIKRSVKQEMNAENYPYYQASQTQELKDTNIDLSAKSESSSSSLPVSWILIGVAVIIGGILSIVSFWKYK
ncbi:MAG: hypothetical protein KGY45_03625, partial [Hadesarchaea archaeon]|nr:hypothetical protein [Hadesarchaea archaeon]